MSNIALIPNKVIATLLANKENKVIKRYTDYIAAVLCYISPEDKCDEGKDYKSIRIPKAELKARFGFNKNVFYRDLWDWSNHVASIVFNVATNNAKDLKTSNIQIENLAQDNYITVIIPEKLLQQFTDVKEGNDGFTSIQVDRLLAFKNEYTKRMYLLLSDKRIVFDVAKEYNEEEIREVLGLQKKYTAFKDVLHYGLRLAMEELMQQENPDIYFTYQAATGIRGKINGVSIIKKDARKELTVTQIQLEKSYNKHIVNQGFTPEQLKQYYGYLEGVLRLTEHDSRKVVERIPYQKVLPILKDCAARFQRADKDKTAKQYKNRGGYTASEIRRVFGSNILAGDDDYTDFMNSLTPLEKAA